MKFVQATVTIDLTVEFPAKSLKGAKRLAEDWKFVKGFLEHADVGSVCLEHAEEVTDEARIRELKERLKPGKQGKALRFGLGLLGLAAARRK